MINTEYFEHKIKALPDAKLTALLRFTNDANREIILLAIREARSRGMDVPLRDIPVKSQNEVREVSADDLEKLKGWNWAAFLITPLWALANKLDRWVVICSFLPVLTHIYLGVKGTRLAYSKSNFYSIDDFVKLQHYWSRTAIRFVWISIAIILLFELIDAITG